MSPEKKATIIMLLAVVAVIGACICEPFLDFLLLLFIFNLLLCLFSLIWGAIAVGMGSNLVDDPADSLEIIFKVVYIKPFKFIKGFFNAYFKGRQSK